MMNIGSLKNIRSGDNLFREVQKSFSSDQFYKSKWSLFRHKEKEKKKEIKEEVLILKLKVILVCISSFIGDI